MFIDKVSHLIEQIKMVDIGSMLLNEGQRSYLHDLAFSSAGQHH